MLENCPSSLLLVPIHLIQVGLAGLRFSHLKFGTISLSRADFRACYWPGCLKWGKNVLEMLWEGGDWSKAALGVLGVFSQLSE